MTGNGVCAPHQRPQRRLAPVPTPPQLQRVKPSIGDRAVLIAALFLCLTSIALFCIGAWTVGRWVWGALS